MDLWDFPDSWGIARCLGPRDEFPERWREHSAVAEAVETSLAFAGTGVDAFRFDKIGTWTLRLEMESGEIRLESDKGEITVKDDVARDLGEAFRYASKTWFPPSGENPELLYFSALRRYMHFAR